MYGKVEYDPEADAFRCAECGRWYRGLARHITRHHKITTREYKLKWGIDLKESLISKEMTKKLRNANLKHKTYRNLQAGESYRFKKGDSRRQHYKRSEQTKKRLRILRKLTSHGKIKTKKKQ